MPTSISPLRKVACKAVSCTRHSVGQADRHPRGCFSKSCMYLVFVADGQLFLCGALEHVACVRVCMCDLYTTLIGIGLCMHVVHSVSCVVELKRQRQRPQADPRHPSPTMDLRRRQKDRGASVRIQHVGVGLRTTHTRQKINVRSQLACAHPHGLTPLSTRYFMMAGNAIAKCNAVLPW